MPLPDNRSIPVIFPQAGQAQTTATNVQVQINVSNQGPALDMKVGQMTRNKQGQAKLILDVVTYGVMTNPGLRAALKSV